MKLADERASIAAGVAIGAVLCPGDVVTLAGPLGAGKTTLARGILHALGFTGEVPSPTFPIVIPYDGPELRLPVWHVDLYRIEDPDDARELGLDEARHDGALIVEWPERLGVEAWPDVLALRLEPEGEARRLTAMVPPSWAARWPLR